MPKHYIDWKRDVRDERFYIAQNTYNYTAQKKAAILEEIQKSDHELKALMLTKGFVCILLFVAGIYLLIRYSRTKKEPGWKALVTCFILFICTTGLKLFSWTTFSGSPEINLLNLSPADTSLSNIYNDNFKGKVVYVDFWGTTCAPCLEEFRNFTKPLKQHFKNRPDLAYLYICSGTKLVWKQQLQKFNIEGSHIFLNKSAYAALYHSAVRGSKDSTLEMPRYLIIDEKGYVADKDAPPPSEMDSLAARLDKYLSTSKQPQ